MKRCPECRRVETDNTLAFCRADGTALVSDSGSVSADAGTIKFGSAPVSSEIETSVLPRASTSPEINRPTAPTTVLPAQQTHETARALSKPKRRKAIIAIASLITLALIAGAYLYLPRGKNAAAPIESIAVMPFVNESGNADVEYLSDGMTETLISSLSQLPNLRVKARSSVFRYKGKESDAKTIGNELGVQAVLNGRVTQRGDDVTLRLELVDVQTEDVLWSDKYDRKQNNLITLQSEIARDVSSKLKSKLSGAEAAKVAKNYTTNAEAYQFYLKGRFFARQYSLDGFNKSVEAFSRAIALDPNYGLAYSGLSDAYFVASTVHIRPAEALPKVGEYARKALELDDSLAAAHHSLANYKSNYEHDFAGAEREFLRSLELDPNEPLTYYDYAWAFLATIGEFDRAIAMAERGRQIDPLAVDMAGLSGGMYALAGRNDEAIQRLQDALKLDDKSWWVYHWLGVAYCQKGLFDRSIESFQAAAKLDNSLLIRGALAHVLARAGRKADAQRVIDELLEESKTRYVPASALVMGYSGLGDKEKAFAWLEKGYESHDEWLLGLNVYPMFAPLRGDPRHKEMLKRLNLPE